MVTLLKSMMDSDLSNGEMANEINAAFPSAQLTRNAVIGKRTRLGLGSTRPIGRQAKAAKKGPHTSVQRIRVKQISKPLPKEKVAPNPAAHVNLNDLGDAMCKWPVGRPPMGDDLYCGMPTEGVRIVYCNHHIALARKSVNDPVQGYINKKKSRWSV